MDGLDDKIYITQYKIYITHYKPRMFQVFDMALQFFPLECCNITLPPFNIVSEYLCPLSIFFVYSLEYTTSKDIKCF